MSQLTKKISELTTASQLKNTDLIPIVQDGINKKIPGDLLLNSVHSHANKVELDKIAIGDKAKWDAKSNFDGNYNNLTNKPVIPVVDVNKNYVDTKISEINTTFGVDVIQNKEDTLIAKNIGKEVIYNNIFGLNSFRNKLKELDRMNTIINVNILGTSIACGGIASDYRLKGWAGVLRSFFNSKYEDVGQGFIPAFQKTTLDRNMWTFEGAGWYDSIGFGVMNDTKITSNVNDKATLSFNGTGITLITFEGGYSGNIEMKIDGVSKGIFNLYNSSGINPVKECVITGLTPGNHILEVKNLEQDKAFVLVGAYETKGTKGIRINQLSKFGGTSTMATSGGENCHKAQTDYWRPALTIIEFQTNDYYNQLPITEFKNNIQTLITRAKSYGDVILMPNGIREESDTKTIKQTQYIQALKELAISNNIVFIDIFNKWGGLFKYAKQSLGFIEDTVHPNDLGHKDIANVIIKEFEQNIQFNNISSQLETIEQEIPSIANNDYCFGFENLKRFFNSNAPIVTTYGDSIFAGTGSSGNNSLVEQLRNNLAINFGLKGLGYYQLNPSSARGEEYSRWGICNLMINNINGVQIQYALSSQLRDIKNIFTLIYGSDEDGGVAEIRENSSTGTLLGEINCYSPSKEIKTIEVELNQYKNLVIVPKNNSKIYVNGIIAKYKNTSGSVLNNVCFGGHGLKMYSDIDLLYTAKIFKDSDLFIFEMGTNDYNGIAIDEWARRAEIVCNELKKNNVDILFMVMGTNPQQEADINFDSTWKEAKRKLAKKYNGAYLDIDKCWGGYTNGNRNGLYIDTIHPSVKGHDSVASILNSLLLKTVYRYYDKMMVNNQDINLAQAYIDSLKVTNNSTLDYISDYKNNIFRGKNYFMQDSALFTVGGCTGVPSILAGGNTAQRPTAQNSEKYMMYFDTILKKPIWFDGTNWLDNQLVIRTLVPPSKYTSGNKGEVAFDTNYVYFCVESNNWVRISIDKTWN